MTGRVLTGYRHELVITARPSFLGHLLAVVIGGLLALMVVGMGL